MPSFDIVKTVQPDMTFRVASVLDSFDLEPSHANEHFTGDIAIENREWNVGLIVGASGTGKSTIAKETFGDAYIRGFDYHAKSIIDDMPKEKTVTDITRAFTSVGFSSPPSWLKPYDVLSNGEKMRVDLARCILEERDLFVFDEFTSVVNREVAKTGSYAISKAVRRLGKQFVAVACHRDIIDWLEPDWIYDTDEQRFFGIRVTEGPKSTLTSSGYTKRKQNDYGARLESITI
ncbi:hypothetical protein [Alicyclobacillus sp. ALC3]|uniref:hypothetical protein n=1 Tax=Alicyclobacillus sp. ALC3 TaxID=2796143 RepID=UPI0023789E47|nr:hypothetical protein [Alicyclobacillus sp. ALC3]